MPQATTPKHTLKVFLCHASEDKVAVRALYNRMTKDGMDAWLDKEKLIAGQDWALEIREAVREADVVVVCLSKQFNQDGFRQREVKLALETALNKPEGKIFIIPARLDDCDTPSSLSKWHRVDLFEENGYDNLRKAFRTRADEINATLEMKKKNLLSAVEKKKENNEKKIESNSPKWASNIYISVIIILIVTGIIWSVNKIKATPSPTSIPTISTETITPTLAPTDTLIPGTPTFTPTPATDTPVPTFTPLPIDLGKDWLAGCISTLWTIYPADVPMIERGDGCWKEPLHTFSAENGDLDFLAERGKGDPEVYGLFAPLPESGTVTFTIRLNELSNVDILMGVFPEPDIESQGLLMTILNGNVNKRAIVQKDPLTYETLQGSQAVSQANGYSISFTFNNISATSIVNPHVFVTNSVSVPSSQKWLFLGYKGLKGYYRIEGTFLNFELTP